MPVRSIRRVIMNREVLWRFNYKFPLVGFRLRKKERKNNNNNNKNLAIICLVCCFHLAYCCVSQCFLERENNVEFILLVLFLSEFFFLCFLWQSFRLSASVYPVLFRVTASPCLYLMSFRIAIIRCSSSLDYVCTRIFWLFKQMCP